MTWQSYQEFAQSIGKRVDASRTVVCVQGLGFVGTAMATAVASARDENGEPHFNVIGVDVPNSAGEEKVRLLNQGCLPFNTADEKLLAALNECARRGNLVCSTDWDVLSLADIAIVDIPFDIEQCEGGPRAKWEPFRVAIAELGRRLRPGSLVIVETTVPPGTCQRVVVPGLAAELEKRGLPADAILVAHSSERVMPGKNYLDSIINLWRVYAGATPAAAAACGAFLSKVVNVKAFPLTRLASTTASETGKVLENSYRAMTIAFMDEWGRFAEQVGINLFDVIAAIRLRPTHSNMRQPGFGVGGYCLTKDPLFAKVAARELFGYAEMDFPFSTRAVAVNAAMPLLSVAKARAILGGSLAGKKVLLLGVSYREDVGDTRHSPSAVFVKQACAEGAAVTCHDPLLDFWPELNMAVAQALPSPADFDLVVFAVSHHEYRALDAGQWLNGGKVAVLDSNNVLRPTQREAFRALGCPVHGIGRGNDQ